MTTSAVGFPLETVYHITGVTRGFPGVVTLDEVSRQYALSVQDEQTITIHNVLGMIELNTNRYIIKDLDVIAKTFSLYDIFRKPVDTTNFRPYVAAGEIDIISFPGNPPGLMYNTD